VRSGDVALTGAPQGSAVVAVVDDDASVRRSLHRLLRLPGYAVETFASGREFLEWSSLGRAACLVLDVHMNEMSGFDLQERLAVPIIYMTAHDDAATRAGIEKSGAAGHLWKPFDDQALLDAIRGAIRCGRGSAETRDHAPIGMLWFLALPRSTRTRRRT
jgi:FixJ family two-component response regulator